MLLCTVHPNKAVNDPRCVIIYKWRANIKKKKIAKIWRITPIKQQISLICLNFYECSYGLAMNNEHGIWKFGFPNNFSKIKGSLHSSCPSKKILLNKPRIIYWVIHRADKLVIKLGNFNINFNLLLLCFFLHGLL